MPTISISQNDAKLEDQVTLFLDFLGFSDAASQHNSDTLKALLQLLHSLSGMRSDFSINIAPNSDGSTSKSFTPAISTFSDHIVVSYPLGRVSFLDRRHLAMLPILQRLEEMVAVIAGAAVRIGFLVRGGISLGKLYHAGGVVFGPAMVESFNLESRLANYPRIAVSPALLEYLERNEITYDSMKPDYDGVICLDYFRLMIMRSPTSGENFDDQVKTWLNQIHLIISRNIRELTESKQLSARAKWVWFSTRLAETIEKDPFFRQFGIDASMLATNGKS
jgi:hypothetical protein